MKSGGARSGLYTTGRGDESHRLEFCLWNTSREERVCLFEFCLFRLLLLLLLLNCCC